VSVSGCCSLSVCVCDLLIVLLFFPFLQGLSALVKERPSNPYTHIHISIDMYMYIDK